MTAVRTTELRRLVTALEADLLRHSEEIPEVLAHLRVEYAKAKDAVRTGQAFEVWREDQLTQSAVAWVLACVFVRFCEDTGLIEEPRLGGAGERLALARDHTTQFFIDEPDASHREYLLDAFARAAALPGMGGLFDQARNPLYRLPLSADGARALLDAFRALDPDSGEPLHDFRDPERSTRFLGDLYQNLSESARKRYALLQTPEFVERFILSRTLDPAIEEFGLAGTSLIDPACGSGHFLLGAFGRLFVLWQEREPGTNPRALAQRALEQIAGVDLNPFAIAIAELRLLVAALDACGIERLEDAPGFRFNLAVGDSLLHGRTPGRLAGTEEAAVRLDLRHVYETEDREALSGILGRHYAAVVANPPYITPKDPALNAAYRDKFKTCHRQYALSVPFMERLFDLAEPDANGTPAGFVGQITANSFMKREFGKPLVEQELPKWDLTAVIDTSGAYIPGHGTPTAILFTRARGPVLDAVQGVLGIRGEPTTPKDPARGLVWSEIVRLSDAERAEGDYVSVEPLARDRLARHPWSLQGGGASAVMAALRTGRVLSSATAIIGVVGRSSADEVHLVDDDVFKRAGIEPELTRPAAIGEQVRDWNIQAGPCALFPYGRREPLEILRFPGAHRFLWPFRAHMESRVTFGNRTYREAGLPWWVWHQVSLDRLDDPRALCFAFVATHNHFVLDHGGRVFNRSAPVIKLQATAGEEEHLALLGPLNSSVGCFWMKQVFHTKGVGGIGGGIGDEAWEPRYEHDATKLANFPLPHDLPTDVARRLDVLARESLAVEPKAVLEEHGPSRERLHDADERDESVRRQMIALQEELDWRCYRLYGLLEDDLTFAGEVPEMALGERAFEIVMARTIEAGELETTWFERHRSTPVAEIPSRWPEPYRALVERRIGAIESNDAIRLIERPECKRRWNTERWEDRQRRALREWLMRRMERDDVWADLRLRSAAQIADVVRGDPQVLEAVELHTGSPEFDLTAVVAAVAAEEAVPYLSALRYTDSGLGKRAVWERTWQLQRQEDAIEALTELEPTDPRRIEPEEAVRRRRNEVGTIDVPPKYGKPDFRTDAGWRLRGKLDVPKEMLVAFPLAEREHDPTPVFGWAGWDDEQRARALATYIVEVQEHEAWPAERLTPLLAGLRELLPWVRQWHADRSADYGMPPADWYETFMEERLRGLGLTEDDLARWRPPETRRGRRQRA